MKFLCDNCKAKYQIADDKVAGKTVRMKCRKCGHQIEVRAAVTETSVSSALNDLESPSQISRNSLATSLASQKPRAQAASSPGAGHASHAGHAGHGGALAGAFQRTVQDGSVQSPSQPSNLELSVSDEWYVAINGVPVGPVRVSELRRKAATGAITEDSLCWQEGLEEWRPIRAVPELAAIVREAAQSNRVSIVGPHQSEPRMPAVQAPRAPQKPATPAPPAARAPEAPREVTRPLGAPLGNAPLGSPLGGGMTGGGGRSNVVPLHARSSTAEKIDDVSLAPFGSAATALAPVVAPGAAPAPEVAPAPAATPFAPPAAQLSPVPVADPFAPPPPAIGGSAPPAPAAVAPAVAAPAMAPPTVQKRGVPLWFFAVFAVALLGLVAFLALHQPPPQQIIVQVPTPPASQTAPPLPTDIPPPVASTEPTPSATASTKPAAASGPKSTAVAAAAATASEKKTADLSGLLPGIGGPSAGPGGPGSGSGGGLDSASVQRVVRDRQAGVKRSCWERGGGEQKSSANITVTANVAANGTVSSASSTGDDPVIGKCIENQVRTWTFPAPGSPTTVAIPFHFVRQ